ncbi:MAG: IS3 family transposase [Cyclobacteriaceae bacterium]
MRTVEKSRRIGLTTVEKVCSCLRLKRDAYYKIKGRLIKQKGTEAKVISLVKKERETQPRVGTVKLQKHLADDFFKLGIKMGRDRLFDVLRTNDMLVRRKKTSFKTTNSYHHFHKYNNLIKDLKITKPNQVWVSDITYIRTVKGFCYLALITDLYSRKIVGYDLSDSLELAGCLRALQKALANARPAVGLIHHSDRGIQYCSKQYVEKLTKKKVKISMTEENHCYENAVAERVNGILKDEFYLDHHFANTNHAKKATKSAISIYNNKRLHLSLNLKTPEKVYRKTA